MDKDPRLPEDWGSTAMIKKILEKQKQIGHVPKVLSFSTPYTFGKHPLIIDEEPVLRKLTMEDANAVRTSQCPGQCKIGTALKDRLNVLANVDQLIAENHPQETVIQTLRNAGVMGVNRANVTRHKQHLLIAIEPKEKEKVVAEGSPQHRMDSPEFTITVPKGLGISKAQVKEMLANFNTRERLLSQISRIESYLDFLDTDAGQKVPNAHGHRAKYLDIYKNYLAVLSSMRDATTGESEMNWNEFFKRLNAKDKPPAPPPS